jgi:radical SAM superfamily enzyme YgiQ (UPF0313 family)
MNVLLVAPETPDTFWSFRHALPFVSKRVAFPPLGLLTVAAMLPRPWNLKLVDLNRDSLRDEDVLWADYVLVSAMLVHRSSVREIAGRCAAMRTPVIGGGPLFTSGHCDFPEIGHFVLGEAEDVIGELVADMEARQLRPVYEAEGFPDVKRSPVPRWDLVDVRDYASLAVQFSRGCPFNCEFCDIVVMNGRVPRTKSPAQVAAELELLRSLGWKGAVFLVDDNFIGNKRRVKELLREIIAWRDLRAPRMTFTTEASLNLADDPELLDLMVRAGFRRVFLGIETPVPEGLTECSKVQNLGRDLAASVRTIQTAGMEVLGGFIVGFDSDREDVFQRQFEFIQRAGVVTAMVGLLTALPKTRLYRRLAEEGRLLQESSGNNTDASCNFIPRLDPNLLVGGYRRLVNRLYEPAAYYERARAFLAQYRPRGPGSRPGWTECRAAVRALWVLGVRHHGRGPYWRFLGHVLTHHPRAFGYAVALAIYGHHFRRVAEDL